VLQVQERQFSEQRTWLARKFTIQSWETADAAVEFTMSSPVLIAFILEGQIQSTIHITATLSVYARLRLVNAFKLIAFVIVAIPCTHAFVYLSRPDSSTCSIILVSIVQSIATVSTKAFHFEQKNADCIVLCVGTRTSTCKRRVWCAALFIRSLRVSLRAFENCIPTGPPR
jgi:hypothetical protein